mmetsp:Transcript_94939/g.207646  ORF Transcript_94939/g.207646 Transcript_94939/m.207646 type:complete len:883 (-) Transcript_94939:203-2851(-)
MAHLAATTGQQAPERVKPVKPAGLTKEELECNIDIILAETETETLLSFPSLCVAVDSPLHASVFARNKAYDDLCASKADSDQYRDQHVQTLNQPHKSKEVWAPAPSQETVEVSANGWDIYDTFSSDPVPKHKQIQQACEKESEASVAQAIKMPGCLFTMNEPYPSHEQQKETPAKDKDKRKRDKPGTSGKLGMLSGGTSSINATGVSGMVGAAGSGGSGGNSKLLGGGPSDTGLIAPNGAGGPVYRKPRGLMPLVGTTAEDQAKDKDKDKKKKDGKSSGKVGSLAGGSSTLVAGDNNNSAQPKTGTLGGGPSETGLGAGASGTVVVGAEGEAGVAVPGTTSPVPGASATSAAAAAGEDGQLVEAKPDEEGGEALPEGQASGEAMSWQLGADATIPEELTQAVKVMERIVSQNVFHKQHMIYRNYPTLEELARLDQLRAEEGSVDQNNTESVLGGTDTITQALGAELDVAEAIEEDEEMGMDMNMSEDSENPSLEDLFCFDAPQLTQGTTVTCAEWNRHNQDLLAVSYGDTSPVPMTQGGLVLFWSLKNPTYPERVLRTRHGVTSLHFSSVHPNMVAAGTHDGSVMIWDLRRPSDQPVLRSGCSSSQQNDQKHTDIVWETRWVEQLPDKQPPELLVSVSSDGNVLQWSMKKGLEQQLLMPLKRVPNRQLGSNSVYGHKEGIVFRRSGGFSIDFPRHDPSTYMVGTEDGLIHRCSTSYNEQYLETYYGHSGPVYKVRCNPFMSTAFLTCSADWTIRLWTTKKIPGHQPDTPLLTFQSTGLCDAVNDVIWAPQNATAFAAAMEDGRVEYWDLSEKPLDPVIVHYPLGQEERRRRTCVRFSPNSPVLIAGDDRGSVVVMRMYNTNQSYYSDQEQWDRLNAVMSKKR